MIVGMDSPFIMKLLRSISCVLVLLASVCSVKSMSAFGFLDPLITRIPLCFLNCLLAFGSSSML